MLSTDAVVHELYGTEAVREAVRARLGEEVMADGRIERAAVARRVFADPAERAWLEGLLWPLVGERVAAFRAAASGRRPPPVAVVVETPLLFEAGLDGIYDATIAVSADDGLRAARTGARGQEALAEREGRQLSQAEKARRATYAVSNCGTVAELDGQLAVVLDDLRRR